MKVRARVKAREYWPEWAHCCEAGISTRVSLGEMIIDLSKPRVLNEPYCTQCGVSVGHDLANYPDVADNQYVPVELLDIDEGPMEAQ